MCAPHSRLEVLLKPKYGQHKVISRLEIWTDDTGKGEKTKCWKCDKELDRKDGGTIIKGKVVTVHNESNTTQADIDYLNKQLGKYNDGNGGCDVAICYECHIDGLFNVWNLR